MGKFYVIFFVLIFIASYELVSIFENLQVNNPKVRFLASLIVLSKKMNDRALRMANRKLGEADINSDSQTTITVNTTS